MVPKYVIDVSIIWLNDNINSRNTWFPTTDVQTQNISKLRYANRRTPTECRHTVAMQATEYQCWRDVGSRSRRCRPVPTLGQRRNASWVGLNFMERTQLKFFYHLQVYNAVPWEYLSSNIWIFFMTLRSAKRGEKLELWSSVINNGAKYFIYGTQ